MDEKKLWQKISGSITYYLSSYDREKSNEELLEDYLFLDFQLTLPHYRLELTHWMSN